jgi:hypothetical protein
MPARQLLTLTARFEGRCEQLSQTAAALFAWKQLRQQLDVWLMHTLYVLQLLFTAVVCFAGCFYAGRRGSDACSMRSVAGVLLLRSAAASAACAAA